jgi:hypothetical protein
MGGVKSKYEFDWEEYKERYPQLLRMEKVVAPKLERYEEMMFNFIIGLLL